MPEDPNAPTPADPNAPPNVPPADPAWYAGFDEATRGYIEARGLKDKSLSEAFLATAAAQQEAQRFVGAPADQLLRLPTDNTPEAWAPIWKRLGAADTVDGYDFGDVRTDATAPLVDSLRAAAVAANVPVAQAKSLAAAVVKFQADQAAEAERAKAEVLTQQKATLAANWGQNAAANMDVARTGAQRLGITKEQLDALESVTGYDKVMELLRKVGATTAEDTFQSGGGGGGTGADPALSSVSAAKARFEELKQDQEWLSKWNAGGAKEVREYQALLRAMNPEQYAST